MGTRAAAFSAKVSVTCDLCLTRGGHHLTTALTSSLPDQVSARVPAEGECWGGADTDRVGPVHLLQVVHHHPPQHTEGRAGPALPHDQEPRAGHRATVSVPHPGLQGALQHSLRLHARPAPGHLLLLHLRQVPPHPPGLPLPLHGQDDGGGVPLQHDGAGGPAAGVAVSRVS